MEKKCALAAEARQACTTGQFDASPGLAPAARSTRTHSSRASVATPSDLHAIHKGVRPYLFCRLTLAPALSRILAMRVWFV